MIAETANLATALDDVKEASVATNVVPSVIEVAGSIEISQMIRREQISSTGCLTKRRPEKHSRSNGFKLLAQSRTRWGSQ
jgi:hypothetical protein